PGDAVQREMFLRSGQEPVGQAKDVWTNANIGGPTTLSQLMAAQAPPQPTLPAGTPTTVPYNTPVSAPPTSSSAPTATATPPAPAPVPALARGTLRGKIGRAH